MLTADERLDRLDALARRIAAGFHMHNVNDTGIYPYEAVAEAQNIIADSPAPIDPLLIKAREIAQRHTYMDVDVTTGEYDHYSTVQAALEALRSAQP